MISEYIESILANGWKLTGNSHCPWVYNCIGVNNHRHFFMYLINMTLGIITYDWLTYRCEFVQPPPYRQAANVNRPLRSL